MRRVGRKATTACCFISFFGYKSVVAVHRRGVPNDIRREKNFPFYILQYENDSLDLPMSWDSRTLDSPVVRANHFYLFLIFRIFSNFEKIRKETFTHRILCGGCSTCANKAATNVCVFTTRQGKSSILWPFSASWWAQGNLKKNKTKTGEGRWGSVRIDDDDT